MKIVFAFDIDEQVLVEAKLCARPSPQGSLGSLQCPIDLPPGLVRIVIYNSHLPKIEQIAFQGRVGYPLRILNPWKIRTYKMSEYT